MNKPKTPQERRCSKHNDPDCECFIDNHSFDKETPQEKQLSSCCKAEIAIHSGEEGTNYYVCSACNLPVNPDGTNPHKLLKPAPQEKEIMLPAEQLHIKAKNLHRSLIRKKKWNRIKCFFGFHKWQYWQPEQVKIKFCENCQKEKRVDPYLWNQD